MNTNDIILSIDAEISRLQRVIALLTQTSGLTPAKRKLEWTPVAYGNSKAASFQRADVDAKVAKRRRISPAGRARIVAAQKARWAKSRSAA